MQLADVNQCIIASLYQLGNNNLPQLYNLDLTLRVINNPK